MSDGFTALRDMVQSIRHVNFPDLSAELVDEVLTGERRHEEERGRALQLVRTALDTAAAKAVDDESDGKA